MSYGRRVVSLEYRVRTAIAAWLRRVAGRRSYWEFFVLGISVEVDAHRWATRVSRWADRIDFPLLPRHTCATKADVLQAEWAAAGAVVVKRMMADLERHYVGMASGWSDITIEQTPIP